tara:strand:+ start:723 stop:1433 length:711 start_codon:yes stop_codon:yes gene_type:complete
MLKKKIQQMKKIFKCLKYPKYFYAYFNLICPLFELKEPLLKIGYIKNIIDVGSNKGQFSLISRIIYPESFIYSFEPQEKYLNLQKKIFHNKIKFYNCCLGEKEYFKDLYITQREDSSSLLEPSISENKIYKVKKKIKVKIKTLNNIFKNKKLENSLMKIDVQGYEYQVLKGSSKIINKINYLLIELSSQGIYKHQIDKYKIIEFLKTKNFKIIKKYNKSMIENNIYQHDYLFKRIC